MPDPFHRLNTNPSGYDAFPAGYDYVNNPALNGDAGVPANADTKKVGGPNDGTYYVGFGEDATSSDANRGFQALAQNTDFLDNAIRRPLAVPKRTTNAVAGAPVSSILLPDVSGVFVGSAVQAIPETFKTLFEVLDANDNEVIDPTTGAQCVVTAIVGVPAVVIGDGFSPGTVTLTITPAIPTGTTYRVYYANKSNLLTMPTDTFTVIKIRGAQELPAGFEDFQKQISRTPGLNVLALVATVLETPDGVRLSKSNSLAYDVDPDGTVGGIHRHFFRKARDVGGALTLMEINDDTAIGGGSVGRFRLASGIIEEFIGTGFVRDANIAGGAGSGGPFMPWSSATAAKGDQYLRIFEHGVVGSAATVSILRQINAKWTVTVGDGTISYGDFSGADALQQVFAYYTAIASSITGLHILMKSGAYTISDGLGTLSLPAGVEVTIEGTDSTSVVISCTATTTPINLASNDTILRLKSLSLTRTSGFATTITTSNRNAVSAEDCTFTNAQILLKDLDLFGKSSPIVFYAKRCKFTNSSSGVSGPIIIFRATAASSATDDPSYLLEDCLLSQGLTAKPVVQVQGDPAGAMGSDVFWGKLEFNRCEFDTSSTTVTTGDPDGPSGVLDLAPFGSNALAIGNGLFIRDINFINCIVRGGKGNSANAAVGLLWLAATGTTDGNTGGDIQVVNLRIDGGVWASGKQNSSLIPFFVVGTYGGAGAGQAPKTILKNVQFGWTDKIALAGIKKGSFTTTKYGVMPVSLSGPATADQGAFYFSTPDVEIKNIFFIGAITEDSDTGEVWINNCDSLDLDGLIIGDGAGGGGSSMSTGAGGAKPHFRVSIFMSPVDSAVGLPDSNRVARRIHVDCNGKTPLNITGLVGVLLVIPNGLLSVEDCLIRNCAGGNAVGIQMPVNPSTNAQVKGLKLRRNRVRNIGNTGIQVFSSGAGSVDVIDDLEVSLNVATGCTHVGISISSVNSGTLTRLGVGALIHGNRCYENGSGDAQLYVVMAKFDDGTSNGFPVIISNNFGGHSTGTTATIQVGSSHTANEPNMIIVGNSCQDNNGLIEGQLGVRRANGAAFPADEGVSAVPSIRGVETGFATNVVTIYRKFVDGQPMIQNAGRLLHLA